MAGRPAFIAVQLAAWLLFGITAVAPISNAAASWKASPTRLLLLIIGNLENTAGRSGVDHMRGTRRQRQAADVEVRQAGVECTPVCSAVGALKNAAARSRGIENVRIRRVDQERG